MDRGGMSHFARMRWAGLIAWFVASSLLPGRFEVQAAQAQRATPGTPAVAATPAESVPCGPILGIGDATVACVNVVQTVVDAPAVDLLIDERPVITNLPFAATSGFLPLTAGTYGLRLTLAGDSSNVVAESPNLTVESGVAYEVAAIGLREDGSGTFTVLPLDLSPVPGEAARVRIYHAIVNGPPIDIAESDSGVIRIADIAPLSATEYVTIDAGSIALEARAAGSDEVLLPLGTETLAPQTVVSLYLAGSADQTDALRLIPIVISLEGTPSIGTPVATMEATPVR